MTMMSIFFQSAPDAVHRPPCQSLGGRWQMWRSWSKNARKDGREEPSRSTTRRAANSSFLFGYSSSLRLSNVIRTALPGRVEVSRSRDGNNVSKCSLEPIAFSAQTQREMDGSFNGGTHAWRGQFKKGAKSIFASVRTREMALGRLLASFCGRSSTVVC